jgi:hypothetical protein
LGILFPRPRGEPARRILLVDSQLKTGRAITKICRYLRQEYNCAQIWYLALVACGVRGERDGAHLKDLLEYYDDGENRERRVPPDFEVNCWVAYLTPKGAVNLPDELY